MRKVWLEGMLVVEPKLEYLQQGNGKTLFMAECILESVIPDSNEKDYFFLVAFENQAKKLLRDFHEKMIVSIGGILHSYRYRDKCGIPQITSYIAIEDINQIEQYNNDDACEIYEYTNYLNANGYSPLHAEMEEILNEERRLHVSNQY